jgi:hypothetical protein
MQQTILVLFLQLSSTLASSANLADQSPMQVAAGTVAVEKLEATSRPPSAAQVRTSKTTI